MKKLYLLLFLNGLAIASFTPFTTIYFLNIGYDLAFIALSSAIFNIAVTIAEIPFALVVDRYNPKLSLYFGFMLRIIGFYLFTVNFGVNYIILGYILTGVANAATSGPLGAMIINNTQNQTYENIAIVKSRISLYGSISSLLGATIGYSLFNIEEYFIWLAAIIFLLLAILLLVFMPKIKAEGADENSMFFVRGALKLFKMPVFYILIFLNIAAFGPLLAAPVKFNAISPNMLLFGHYAITLTSIVGSKIIHASKI
ncbi:MFS transporter [Bartonella sp. DGB1]|uniref:MFS transporter n=1 Tax=Bartonella sp. DGB1 TaxID=3239807 RepID=UPI0035251028